MAKIDKKTIVEKTNFETGEIITHTSHNVFTVVNGDRYVKFFYDNAIKFLSMGLTKQELLIVLFIAINIDYNNMISIDSHFKDKIYSELNIPKNSIKKALSKIYKTDILCKSGVRGKYYMNPCFFGKGKYKDLLDLSDKINNI